MTMFKASWFRRHDDALPPKSAGGVAPLLADARKLESPPPVQALAPDPVWVIYASETGVAEHLAHDTCHVLQDAGVASRLLPFDELDLGKLQAISHALFVASTCYDGDPPDMAEEFCRQHMSKPAWLPQLRYGLLALGDSYYDEFCGFGRQLCQWLQVSGAQTWFEAIEMDDQNEAAAQRWQDNLRVVIQHRLADGSPAA